MSLGERMRMLARMAARARFSQAGFSSTFYLPVLRPRCHRLVMLSLDDALLIYAPKMPNNLRLSFLAASLVLACGFSSAQAADNAPQTLRFADFFQTPVGAAGLQPTERLLAAQDQQVRLVGWMVAQEDPAPGAFLLTARPVQMSEHADGDADDLPPATVLVRLPDASRVLPHQPGLIELQGRLHYGRTVAPDGRVAWLELQLAQP
ncbi:hypothetical protein LRH25_10920 [Ideonella azotifigens]|uniref:hypothetical protein n=1 Tax=Ideonella azotifigens TaxID=513160 RepID=UPI001E367B9A|nr:hypothetical protein [Ideonella azotifigens]MCD2340858.1 hypothetical protein [Ideonella azotifigens]